MGKVDTYDTHLDQLTQQGGSPVGVLCELVAGGTEVQGRTERKAAGMLRRDGCLEFGRRWGIRVCTSDMLVEFLERERGLEGKGLW